VDTNTPQDIAYCRAQVETYDRDRYTLTLAAQAGHRPALWALYAFNHEIAKTREVTRDVHAGHIRLAWWRDRIGSFYASAPMPAHDVARALGDAIHTYNLTCASFDALLDGRMYDLGGDIPASLEGLVAYADATNTPLLDLTAQVLGVPVPEHLGIAWGLTGIIRALPWHAKQNKCFLPMPMLYDLGLMPEQFHHLKSSPALSAAVKQIAGLAQDSLARTRSNDRLFKMQVRLCDLYLKSIAHAQYDPFAVKPVPFLGLRIWF
jgi:phytoene synthase